ncbi:15452_t:CDS:1, partial [Racocetra fulgida]
NNKVNDKRMENVESKKSNVKVGLMKGDKIFKTNDKKYEDLSNPDEKVILKIQSTDKTSNYKNGIMIMFNNSRRDQKKSTDINERVKSAISKIENNKIIVNYVMLIGYN